MTNAITSIKSNFPFVQRPFPGNGGVFLVRNEFTRRDAVMKYILRKLEGGKKNHLSLSHLALFDLVLVASCLHVILIKLFLISYKLEPNSGSMLCSITSQIAFRLPLTHASNCIGRFLFPSPRTAEEIEPP